jgi:ferredoxin--NADP+ reductase
LVLRSIGYYGKAVPGVPFDSNVGVIPNEGGRVTGTPGTYVVGWIKRGPSGFIGTNKSCAEETVGHLIDDFNAGRLTSTRSARQFAQLVSERAPRAIDVRGWRAIDRAELRAGREQGRSRQKLTRLSGLLDAATSPVSRRRLVRR